MDKTRQNPDIREEGSVVFCGCFFVRSDKKELLCCCAGSCSNHVLFCDVFWKLVVFQERKKSLGTHCES